VKAARDGVSPAVPYHPDMSTNERPGTLRLLSDSFRSLLQPPFRILVLLSLLIAVTSTSFSEVPTGTEMALGIVLFVISLYVQIAFILAAGTEDPERSADVWLRGAVRRRCLWRFIGTSLVVVLALFAGALLLVVGVFLAGALVGLAWSATVLERRLPMDAITRSARLANTARVPVGVLFGLLVLVPAGATQAVGALGWIDDLGALWPVSLAVAELFSAAGTIGLTRLFVALGGAETPPFDRLAPPKPAPPP
jgi:hypothetical protein